jgi:hypothetical protein
MTLLFKVENVFDISGRGCVVPVPTAADFKIQATD